MLQVNLVHHEYEEGDFFIGSALADGDVTVYREFDDSGLERWIVAQAPANATPVRMEVEPDGNNGLEYVLVLA